MEMVYLFGFLLYCPSVNYTLVELAGGQKERVKLSEKMKAIEEEGREGEGR